LCFFPFSVFTVTLTETLNSASITLSTAGIANARLDAEVLLSHIIHKDRIWLITHRDDVLDDKNQRDFDEAIERRSKREPLQYIIGNQEFSGL